MAVGEKLGKVFGAVGSGLSFIPGPWSAVGIALSAAGTAASAVAEKKQAKEMQEKDQKAQSVNQSEPLQEDPGRVDASQMDGAQGTAQTQPPQRNVFQSAAPSLGNYQLQIDQEIANRLMRDSGGLYD